MSNAGLDRRRFLQTAAGSAALGMAAGCSANPETQPAGNAKGEPGPNVLVIMTDQHRADLMTCVGRDLVPTPNIDRIAERGVRFEHAWCPYPVCVASRMSLLTGLYSHSTGAINNDDPLDWRYRTMAHHFADQGYLTGLIGKMHFNDAHNHGFEYYMSINDWLMYLGPQVQLYANEIASHQHGTHFFKSVNDSGAGFPDQEGLWGGKGGISPWAGKVKRYPFTTCTSEMDAEHHLDMFLARETENFLKRYREQPFFLVTSFMKPHTPFFPPREWAEKYPIDTMELPEIGDISGYPPHIQRRINNYKNKDQQALRAGRAGYLGNLAFADTCVGYVLDALEREGLADDTIIVYTSDHGEMDGDHGLFQKFCLFEPSVQVPLIVSYPKKIPQGKVTQALAEYIGIYPTLVELTGVAQPEGMTVVPVEGAPESMDGRSFAQLALQPDSAGPDYIYSEYLLRSNTPQYAVRDARYKYIFNHGSTHELYDMEADPGETVNRIDDQGLSAIKNQLHEQLFERYNPENNPYRTA
jgi:choline-sulfatase